MNPDSPRRFLNGFKLFDLTAPATWGFVVHTDGNTAIEDVLADHGARLWLTEGHTYFLAPASDYSTFGSNIGHAASQFGPLTFKWETPAPTPTAVPVSL